MISFFTLDLTWDMEGKTMDYLTVVGPIDNPQRLISILIFLGGYDFWKVENTEFTKKIMINLKFLKATNPSQMSYSFCAKQFCIS